MALSRREARTEQVIARATELEQRLIVMASQLASFVDTFAHEVIEEEPDDERRE